MTKKKKGKDTFDWGVDSDPNEGLTNPINETDKVNDETILSPDSTTHCQNEDTSIRQNLDVNIDHSKPSANNEAADYGSNHDRDNHDKEQNSDQQQRLKFVVAPGYDSVFFKSTCEMLTARQMVNEYDRTNDSDDDSDGDIKVPSNGFLWGLLISLDAPVLDKKKELQYTKSFRNKKFKAIPQGYKRAMKFADLGDRNKGTFVVFERTNEDCNRHWFHDPRTSNVKVGVRFAILNPRCIGILKSGSFMVETDRPIQVLESPAIPHRTLDTSKARHELRYFVLKETPIKPDKNNPPVAWRTKCNSVSCDRLKHSTNTNYVCACFNQSSRNDTTAKNTVIKISFSFRDSTDEKHRILGFTSLRTSQIFFEDELICTEPNVLMSGGVSQLLIMKYYKTINYINRNGGWTIVGWYIRAVKEEEDKEDDDDDLLHSSIKINISYLYPSRTLPKNIPSDNLITKKDIQSIQDAEDSDHEKHVQCLL